MSFNIGHLHDINNESHFESRKLKHFEVCKVRRFDIMKNHNFNVYSEEDWIFFKEWYRNFYPNRKHYY